MTVGENSNSFQQGILANERAKLFSSNAKSMERSSISSSGLEADVSQVLGGIQLHRPRNVEIPKIVAAVKRRARNGTDEGRVRALRKGVREVV